MPTSALRTGIKLIAIIVLLIIAWFAYRLLLMIFAGVLFGVFLQGAAQLLERHTPLKGGWALAAVLLILCAFIGLLGWRAYPRLADQASSLSRDLPQAVESLRSSLEKSPLGGLLPPKDSPGTGIRKAVTSWAESAASAALSAGTALIVIVFVGIYLAADPGLYRDGIIRLLPESSRDKARQVFPHLGSILQRWLTARIILMIVNGGLTAIGLWILGIPLALILGVIAGLLNFVPNIGPWIAAAPAFLIALGQGTNKALYVAALYLLLQSLDGYVFTPLAQKRAASLPPALIIAFQVLMGILAGPLGLLLATPIAATLLVLIKMLYLHETPDETH